MAVSVTSSAGLAGVVAARLLARMSQADVAAHLGPLAVLFGQHGADQSDERLTAGDSARSARRPVRCSPAAGAAAPCRAGMASILPWPVNARSRGVADHRLDDSCRVKLGHACIVLPGCPGGQGGVPNAEVSRNRQGGSGCRGKACTPGSAATRREAGWTGPGGFKSPPARSAPLYLPRRARCAAWTSAVVLLTTGPTALEITTHPPACKTVDMITAA